MREQEIQLIAAQNTILYGNSWFPEDTRVHQGAVLLLHGMGEHIGRYRAFAHVLTTNGYAVYGYDQRGHGQTGAATNTHGYLGADGFQQLVRDTHVMVKTIQTKHPNLPIILFGHSMGSFVAQSYLLHHARELKACILCGSNGPEGAMLRVGRWIAKRYAKKHGVHAESKLLTQLTFGAYNKSFRPNKTPYDWLTRDEDALQAYLADSHCGFPLSAASMHDMFAAMQMMHRPERIRQIPPSLPIFIISGGLDPVGHQGKGIQRLVDVYRKNGLTHVDHRLYPDARHELLHEINREEVYLDIVNWLRQAV